MPEKMKGDDLFLTILIDIVVDLTDIPKRWKSKKNLSNEDNKCFQYTVTVGFSHEELNF